MKVPTKSGYGLRALIYLAEQGGLEAVPARALIRSLPLLVPGGIHAETLLKCASARSGSS